MISLQCLTQFSLIWANDKLVLNLDKTNVIKFITNKSSQYDLNIGYDEKYIEESVNTKFLDLKIDKHLNKEESYWSTDS
jgi:hypothetical protein